MKFSVSRTALLSVLHTTAKVITNKSTMPILDYFLFEVSENTLKVTASDLETTLVSSLPIQNVESMGIIAVPNKKMLDAIKEISEQPINIEVTTSLQLNIQWETGNSRCVGRFLPRHYRAEPRKQIRLRAYDIRPPLPGTRRDSSNDS